MELLIEMNNKKINEAFKKFNEKIEKLSTEIELLKRARPNAPITTNFPKEEPKEVQSKIDPPQEEEEKEKKPHHRTGGFAPEDVAIDKFFYFGNKKKE